MLVETPVVMHPSLRPAEGSQVTEAALIVTPPSGVQFVIFADQSDWQVHGLRVREVLSLLRHTICG